MLREDLFYFICPDGSCNTAPSFFSISAGSGSTNLVWAVRFFGNLNLTFVQPHHDICFYHIFHLSFVFYDLYMLMN